VRPVQMEQPNPGVFRVHSVLYGCAGANGARAASGSNINHAPGRTTSFADFFIGSSLIEQARFMDVRRYR
jgi:hypothetical protein